MGPTKIIRKYLDSINVVAFMIEMMVMNEHRLTEQTKPMMMMVIMIMTRMSTDIRRGAA